MRATVREQTKKSTFGHDNHVRGFTAKPQNDTASGADVLFEEFQENLRVLFRSIWPVKTAVWLATASDLTPRQAARILARDQGVSLQTLWHLVQSEHGEKFHSIFMNSMAQPAWWKKIKANNRVADLKEQIREHQRELKRELKKAGEGDDE